MSTRPNRIFAAPLALICAIASASAAVPALARQAERIVYLESARAMARTHDAASGRETLAFEAFGRRFAFALERNMRLARALPPGTSATPLEGTLAGAPGSWVRVTRTAEGWSGLFSDGEELYAIDAADSVRAMADAALAVPATGTVVYRLADAYVDPTAASCGVTDPGKPVTALSLYESLGTELAAVTANATAASLQLDVAMVGDYELSLARGAATEDFIIARMNTVDGIYAAQVGIRIAVDSVTVFRTASDPFTSSSSSGLLSELAAYRFGGMASQRRGLTHLFTGRDLDGTTVGIAYLGEICDARLSASLTEARSGGLSSTLVSLAAAHEIGHNFNAPHDGEAGSACASTPTTFLMAPTIGVSNTQFSQCSLTRMQPEIAGAMCLTSADQADADIVAPVTTARHGIDVTYSITFNVRSIGTQTVVGTSADFAIPPGSTLESIAAAGGVCTVTGPLATCALGDLAAGVTRTVTLSLTGRVFGTETLTASVRSASDEVPGNDTVTVSIVTDPVADLEVSIGATPSTIAVGATSQVRVTIGNRGGNDAADARLSIDIPSGFTVTQLTANGLSCTLAPNAVSCDPALLTVNGTRTVDLAVRGDTAGTRTVSAIVLSSAIDPDNSNNSAGVPIAVIDNSTPPPPTGNAGGGGGGGRLSLALLALLLGMLALRLQRSTTSRSFASTCRPGRASSSST
jgi:hypothetical protein